MCIRDRTSRRPTRVSHGSCALMVAHSRISSGASPPVASTVVASPISATIRRTTPSTWPAEPKRMPDCSASTVFLPITDRGAQLLKVELARPRSVIGKNTVEALQSGILFGSAGQVDGVVRRMVAELGEATTVLATGGLAPLLIRECATINAHEPWLTLVGLRLVYARNVDDRNVEARNVEARNVGERITP